MSAHQNFRICCMAFLVGACLFWYIVAPLILGTCEQILGLNRKKHKR
jgi:hypothetical protein